MTAHAPCAFCSNFTTKDHPTEAAAGNGWCTAWEKFVPWNGQPGVLFVRARNEGPRRAFVEKHNKKEMESA